MNRKAPTTIIWNLHTIHGPVSNTSSYDNEQDITDEEYYGNYTFIVIEDNKKKKKKHILNDPSFIQLLDVDYNYEDE